MRNRSYRRHTKELKKRKSHKYYGDKKHADNLKICSCWMCGNPRKYFKEITLKEKIENDKFSRIQKEGFTRIEE